MKNRIFLNPVFLLDSYAFSGLAPLCKAGLNCFSSGDYCVLDLLCISIVLLIDE